MTKWYKIPELRGATHPMMENGKEAFLRAIGFHAALGPESRAGLSSVLQHRELPKDHQLVRVDSECDQVYFVHHGLTRTYYYKDGKDVTDWFSAEGELAVSIISFITGLPDRRGIELLEPSKLVVLRRADLERLSARHHEIERLYRCLVASGIVELQRKFDAQHFESAATRYHALSAEHPSLLQRVPLGMIASYLGMTPETLSRIRADRVS